METTLIRLLKLGYNLDDFYTISFWNSGEYDIVLQGDLTNEKLVKYMNLGYEFNKRENTGFIAINNRVRIVLI